MSKNIEDIAHSIDDGTSVRDFVSRLHGVLTLAISDHRQDPRHRLSRDTHAAIANRIREFFQHEVVTLASKNNTLTLRLESGEEFEIEVRKKT